MIRQGFDAAYIERLVDGDPQTEAQFFAYFGELILIKARARRLSHARAEDVRQETFLRVLRKLRARELHSPESLGAFVNGVCKNVLWECFREQKRHQPPAEEPAPLPDPRPDAEVQLITKERQEAVRRVIQAMSPDNRRLLRQVVLEERDRAEICQELKVKPEYLRVLLHRATKEFRALYIKREKLLPGGNGDDRTAREAGSERTVRKTARDRRTARKTVGL